VEKLCLRFKHAESERQWRDIGFCLSLLSFGTEKSLKKLMDFLPLFQDKLYEPTLFKYLNDIVNKVQKGKQEWKCLIDDFKERLTTCQAKAIEDHEASLDAQNGGKSVSFKEWKELTGESRRLSLPPVDIIPSWTQEEREEEEDDLPEVEDVQAIHETAAPTEDADSDATVEEAPVILSKRTAKKAPVIRKAAKKAAKKAPESRTR
jgi:condensin complex subunit 1